MADDFDPTGLLDQPLVAHPLLPGHEQLTAPLTLSLVRRMARRSGLGQAWSWLGPRDAPSLLTAPVMSASVRALQDEHDDEDDDQDEGSESDAETHECLLPVMDDGV